MKIISKLLLTFSASALSAVSIGAVLTNKVNTPVLNDNSNVKKSNKLTAKRNANNVSVSNTNYTFKKYTPASTTDIAGTLLMANSNNYFLSAADFSGTSNFRSAVYLGEYLQDDVVTLPSLDNDCIWKFIHNSSNIYYIQSLTTSNYLCAPTQTNLTTSSSMSSYCQFYAKTATSGYTISRGSSSYYIYFNPTGPYYQTHKTSKVNFYFYRLSGDVTFDLNGHGTEQPETQTVNDGGLATKPDDPEAEAGYKFDGWYKEATCDTPWDFFSDVVTCDTTLYAKWVADSYDINYYDKGGTAFSGEHETGYPTQHTYGTATALDSPTKTGYDFAGWFENSECEGTAITSLAATGYTAAISLYALWTAQVYTITYYDQNQKEFSGEHESGYPTQHTYGAATALDVPTKEGYDFGGWFTDSACEGTAITTLEATTYTDNIVLYAKWIPNVTYTISYYDKGGLAFSGEHESGYPTQHTYGTETELKRATKTGYDFGGWFTSSDCSGTAITTLSATTEYSDPINLYAKWTPSVYTITYLDKGGDAFSGTHETGYPATHTYATTTTLKGATRTGYAFDGWYTSSDCSGQQVTKLNALTYTSGPIILYAKWSFNLNRTWIQGDVSQTIQLVAQDGLGNALDSTKVSYQSNDTTVATVDDTSTSSKGTVTLISPGTTTITITYSPDDADTITRTCRVTVDENSFVISKTTIATYISDEGETLDAYYNGIKLSSGVTWSSDSDNVTVSNGVLTYKGITETPATITASYTDDVGNVLTATCSVTVSDIRFDVNCASSFKALSNTNRTFKSYINGIEQDDAISCGRGTVTYSSSNPTVAAFDETTKNQLKFVAKGTATITITWTSNDGELTSAVTHTITITANVLK